MFLRKKKRWHFRPPWKTLFLHWRQCRFATLLTGRMLLVTYTPQFHSGTWASSQRWWILRTSIYDLRLWYTAHFASLIYCSLGLSAHLLRAYALPPLRMKLAIVVLAFCGKSALLLCLRKTASTYHNTTAINCLAFILFQVCSSSLSYQCQLPLLPYYFDS